MTNENIIFSNKTEPMRLRPEITFSIPKQNGKNSACRRIYSDSKERRMKKERLK